MAKARTLVGLDVHASKVVAAMLDAETGELRFSRTAGETGRTLALCSELDDPVAQLVLVDYLAAVEAMLIRRDSLERRIAELLPGSPWSELVPRLRCLRGIDTLTAAGLCAEIGDFERFARAGQLMSYLGLVPSEHSTGERRRLGSITKSGSRHARRLLVEAAWHYRRAPRPRGELSQRQAGQPEHVIAL